mmetsp:Transcript_114019/g.322793  ORF Transcript_114019/g.322793 Transcript_114019/m.322793 type:complete len:341 (+) Transcript_114019:81-1103(+)
MGLKATEGQTLHFSSPTDRSLLRRFDVLLRGLAQYEINTYTISIVNRLNVPVQMLLSDAMSGHRSAWSKKIGLGEVVHGTFPVAPIFDLYVVPYVDVMASEFLTMPENSGEDAEAAVMDYGRALALDPRFAANLYRKGGQALTDDEMKYDKKAVGKVMKELKAAAEKKSQGPQDLAKEKYPSYTKLEATEETKDGEQAKESEGNDKKEKLNDQALIFREVAPAQVENKKATLTLTIKDKRIILEGQNMRDSAIEGTCKTGEELFWGCCYKPCISFDGGDKPFRCHFFMCAADEAKCATETSKAEYGSGGSASGMCRAPGWEPVHSVLPGKMANKESIENQ